MKVLPAVNDGHAVWCPSHLGREAYAALDATGRPVLLGCLACHERRYGDVDVDRERTYDLGTGEISRQV